MTLSRPAAAEHYPAAGQTGKPMCGSLLRYSRRVSYLPVTPHKVATLA